MAAVKQRKAEIQLKPVLNVAPWFSFKELNRDRQDGTGCSAGSLIILNILFILV